LIRGAAKNYDDVVIVPAQRYYANLLAILTEQGGNSTIQQRRELAREAFNVSSHYDGKIYSYFLGEEPGSLKISENNYQVLRYGENPHQRGVFYGDMDALFEKLNGKELSYNNLLDVDAAVNLIDEFTNEAPTFAILKHNNACGIATRSSMKEAYESALACDPVSAFGGVLIANGTIDLATAELIHSLFCEVIIAPQFDAVAVELLKQKSNRILLKRNSVKMPTHQVRTALSGFLYQDKDMHTEGVSDFKLATTSAATSEQLSDLVFANKIVKHTKSNTIVLAKNGVLCASGTGQTSRVDALRQAIEKARSFNMDLSNAVMASDAFFPFPDCVEIAREAGVTAVVQPGGSIKDQLSIDYCNAHGVAMYMTGVRHFKH
jgi:phosphoribosylaminoimidazolecarboxamide formyltransferase/IMP cyclohydrolase